MEPPTTGALPAKGKIIVPLTEDEKAEKRLEKVRKNHQAAKSSGRLPAASGAGTERGAREDQEPVEFVHIKTPGRNYAVLQVGVLVVLHVSRLVVCSHHQKRFENYFNAYPSGKFLDKKVCRRPR